MDYIAIEDQLFNRSEKKHRTRTKTKNRNNEKLKKVVYPRVTYTPYDRNTKAYRHLTKELDKIGNERDFNIQLCNYWNELIIEKQEEQKRRRDEEEYIQLGEE